MLGGTSTLLSPWMIPFEHLTSGAMTFAFPLMKSEESLERERDLLALNRLHGAVLLRDRNRG